MYIDVITTERTKKNSPRKRRLSKKSKNKMMKNSVVLCVCVGITIKG